METCSAASSGLSKPSWARIVMCDEFHNVSRLQYWKAPLRLERRYWFLEASAGQSSDSLTPLVRSPFAACHTKKLAVVEKKKVCCMATFHCGETFLWPRAWVRAMAEGKAWQDFVNRLLPHRRCKLPRCHVRVADLPLHTVEDIWSNAFSQPIDDILRCPFMLISSHCLQQCGPWGCRTREGLHNRVQQFSSAVNLLKMGLVLLYRVVSVPFHLPWSIQSYICKHAFQFHHTLFGLRWT